MSYKRAETLLPIELVELIQQYVDGESIYIPRKENNRKQWGQDTKIRSELSSRNQRIYEDYRLGLSTPELATKYYLSVKSIQRILRTIKQSA